MEPSGQGSEGKRRVVTVGFGRWIGEKAAGGKKKLSGTVLAVKLEFEGSSKGIVVI